MYVNKNTLYKAQKVITEWLDLCWVNETADFNNVFIHFQELVTSDQEVSAELSPILFITKKTSDILADLKARGFNVLDGQYFSVSVITKHEDGEVEFNFS